MLARVHHTCFHYSKLTIAFHIKCTFNFPHDMQNHRHSVLKKALQSNTKTLKINISAPNLSCHWLPHLPRRVFHTHRSLSCFIIGSQGPCISRYLPPSLCIRYDFNSWEPAPWSWIHPRHWFIVFFPGWCMTKNTINSCIAMHSCFCPLVGRLSRIH
jgi:hypothetical protein